MFTPYGWWGVGGIHQEYDGDAVIRICSYCGGCYNGVSLRRVDEGGGVEVYFNDAEDGERVLFGFCMVLASVRVLARIDIGVRGLVFLWDLSISNLKKWVMSVINELGF